MFSRDPARRILGGAYGRTNWNWLHIHTVWVAEEERGRVAGGALGLAEEQRLRSLEHFGLRKVEQAVLERQKDSLIDELEIDHRSASKAVGRVSHDQHRTFGERLDEIGIEGMGQSDDKNAIRAALGEVTRKYPRASAGVKAAVDREQKRVKC